jgi:hypothetical protein
MRMNTQHGQRARTWADSHLRVCVHSHRVQKRHGHRGLQAPLGNIVASQGEIVEARATFGCPLEDVR